MALILLWSCLSKNSSLDPVFGLDVRQVWEEKKFTQWP